MPFDGIAIKAVAEELNTSLCSGRIGKIYQPEKDELLLSIRHPKNGTSRLLISANARWARMYITNERKVNPAKPPTFCMLLRKYLEGGKILEVKQLGLERIVHITIEALDDFREWKKKILICEFMGRHSNIILVNPETNIIIDAIKKYDHELSSYREVLPGKEYVIPPSQDKLNPQTASFDDFAQQMWSKVSSNLAASLFDTFSGISPFSSRQICSLAGLDPQLPVEQAGEYELSRLYNFTQNLLNHIDDGIFKSVVIRKNKEVVEFAPYELSLDPTDEMSTFSSINAACDCFYSEKMAALRLDSIKTNLRRNIKTMLDKLYKKRFHQEGDQEKARKSEKYRVWGELLTAYAHQLKKGDKQVVLQDFYSGEDVLIEMVPHLTPIQNAQKYFKIYNKSRSALKHLEKLLDKNQDEIDYLESVMVAVEMAESPDGVEEIIEELIKEGYVKKHTRRSRVQPAKSTPRSFTSSDGLQILVGRNNRQNDILTLKQADRNDLWLHTKEIPGSHVIIKLPKSIESIHQVPDTSLEEAASLAAYYSQAQQADKVPVDYTFRSNVRKPGGAKPGMVIYENYWTIMANPQSEVVKRLLETQP